MPRGLSIVVGRKARRDNLRETARSQEICLSNACAVGHSFRGTADLHPLALSDRSQVRGDRDQVGAAEFGWRPGQAALDAGPQLAF
jgi:hypothetical protein